VKTILSKSLTATVLAITLFACSENGTPNPSQVRGGVAAIPVSAQLSAVQADAQQAQALAAQAAAAAAKTAADAQAMASPSPK